MNNLFSELKRRNVFRVGVAYSVVAWGVMQVVDLVAPRMALPEWVPGFVILLLGIGFPVALVFAWAYEITPEGLKKTAEVDPAISVTRQTGRSIDRMIIAGLVVVVAILLVDRFTGMDVAAGDLALSEDDLSIAVLPFVNLSPDPDQEYFSDGISEELLNLLAQIPDLRVAARTSSFQFKNQNQDITEIGRQLSVRHVLEGSVRKAESGQVRITAQLIDARDGYHLWSDTYDRHLQDVFAVQDEISGEIVDALRDELGLELNQGSDRNVATEVEAAYEAYLRGRYLVVQRRRDAIEAAVEEFRRAVELDPDYAVAHAELSLAYSFLSEQQYGDLTRLQIIERARPHVERALALNPELPETQAALGQLRLDEGDRQGALDAFDRALEINPNYANAIIWSANVLQDALARPDEAFPRYERAARLDPLSVPAVANYMRGLYDRDQVAEAEREATKLRSLSPGLAAFLEAEADLMRGDFRAAFDHAITALEVEPRSPRSREALATVLLDLGLPDEAILLSPGPRPYFYRAAGRNAEALEAARERLEADPGAQAIAGVGLALLTLGQEGEARRYLEEAWESSGGLVSLDGVHPVGAMAYRQLLVGDGNRNASRLREVEAELERWARAMEDAGTLYGFQVPQLAFHHLAMGRQEQGMAAIRRTLASFHTGMLAEPWLYERIRTAELDRLLAEHAVRRDRVASEILGRVCGSANPVASVWTPLPESCDRR